MAAASARLRPAGAHARLVAAGVEARHAFSRGDAIDRAWMGWGALRVLSTQDWAPGAVGQPARIANMEVLLVVLEGRLRIACTGFEPREAGAGGVAWIGAGHGIECRLANASAVAPLRVLEAWVQPDRVNAAPGVALRPGSVIAGTAWDTLAAGAACRGGAADAVLLRQDARLRSARVAAGASLALGAAAGGRGWLQLLEGEGRVDGHAMSAGDGLAWDADAPAPATLVAASGGALRALLFELPA